MLILRIHSTPLLSRGDIHMKQKFIFVDRLGTFRGLEYNPLSAPFLVRQSYKFRNTALLLAYTLGVGNANRINDC